MSSFILKTLERLIFWHLNKTCLNKPDFFHANLYSYKEGISAEDAIHAVVNKIERAFKKNEVAIILFKDIDAAFSSAKIESLVKNMREHGVPNALVEWTKHLLENRQAFAKMGNKIAEKLIGRGTPQGYLISVILWNMVMNNLLKRFPKRHPTDLIVYADDGAACAIGIDETTVANLLQNDIDII